MGFPASDAVRVMLAPSREFRARASTTQGAWTATLRGPLLLAGLLGIVTAVAATGRISARLLVSQTICWSFVPAVQLVIAAALVCSVRGRPVSLARGIELFFAGHGPWSMWLLWAAVAPWVTYHIDLIVVSGLVPAVWTGRIVSAFCREVLGMSPVRARLAALAHQAVTWLVILTYIELASRFLLRFTAEPGS